MIYICLGKHTLRETIEVNRINRTQICNFIDVLASVSGNYISTQCVAFAWLVSELLYDTGLLNIVTPYIYLNRDIDIRRSVFGISLA